MCKSVKEIVVTMPKLAREAGCSTIEMYISFLRCYINKRIMLDEFISLQLYKYTSIGLSEFLTIRHVFKLQKSLNRNATQEELDALHNKHSFNALFRPFIQRDWLYLPDADAEEISSFFEKNNYALLKPVGSCEGRGIEFLDSTNPDTEHILLEHVNDPFILEAFIHQHPAMAALNTSSVNTIRIITARRQNDLLFLGAALRCGRPGSHIDNFHNGGSAYPIDLETGVVNGPGKMLDSNTPLVRNPSSGLIMPGFQIPHWDLLKKSVYQAAFIPEHIGYIAWDIAITEEGVEFIEANVKMPGVTIIQLNGQGICKKLDAFLQGQ